ncbi:Na(+)-translocating NADH-quinone reductase subunit A [Lunatimonas salinarum]|uniref:Na(+)-translocating NADH-quinone reductase subunit A n=1 Tax=Lunatimonas salinarum TaxID=1774590 RepID=UPI001ADF6032|nr:Na(+)-translocating NADH-quinone reductase subunit A [Lunatimonas salinarum]
MSKLVKLKKGFDINLAGKAEKKVESFPTVKTFAIKPTDFLGMERPKVLVKEGDTVKAGTPLLFDKKMEKVQFVAPVSGEVVEVKRGEKRKLLEIKILADSEIEFESFEKLSAADIQSASREKLIDQMTLSGVWPQLIQRPFGVIANPADEPRAIFISGFDSHPLAPDYEILFKGQEQAFQTGIDVLKRLTKGKVFLGLNAEGTAPAAFTNVKGAEINKFSGPHPAGNVGVQIHHIDPINKGEIVWTVSPYGVIQIGKLFLKGVYDASKVVALTGSELKKAAYTNTYLGACVDTFVAGNTKSDNLRIISGNVLTGSKINPDGYMGYYDHQITVIPEGDYEEFLGWLKPSAKKLSFHKAIGMLSFLSRDKEYVVDTNTHGEERPFVISGSFEKVMPMDILPTYLFKAIHANDYDEMEELGIYELVEEDVALCEFIDPSKNEIQALLRSGIELLMYS